MPELRLRIRSLATRHAIRIGIVAIGALCISGVVEMAFSYRESFSQTRELQSAQALATAREIEQLLSSLATALSGTTRLVVDDRQTRPADLAREIGRVMGLFKSISAVRIEDADGRLMLRTSQSGSGQFVSDGWEQGAEGVQAYKPVMGQFGEPYFENGLEPFVDVTFPNIWNGRATMTATLSLRMVSDIVVRLDETAQGRAFLVDERSRLIVHPVQTEMLKQRDLSGWAGVHAARAQLSGPGAVTAAIQGEGIDGRSDTVAAATFVPRTRWLLFLEQPRAAVLQPVFSTLRRTAWLVAVAALMTAGVSAWSGRQLARPMLALRSASARIASGDFGTPVKLETGDELELLAQDLNDMAKRLASFYEELESQVRARTEQLVLARDVAERASQAKTRFLAAASHDLRQPMHTIGLLFGVMTNLSLAEERVGVERKLRASIDTMERLFASLLDISKLDAGSVQAQHAPFPIQDILDRMRVRFEPLAAERGLTLRVRENRSLAISDPGLLERCVGNLVANALTYTRGGGVLVGCRARGDRLLLQVHDTGPGIPDDQLDSIFEEFVRLPTAIGEQGGGLGLGLAIVKRTTLLLGHSLSVRSELGRGSTFEISMTRPAHALAPGPSFQHASTGAFDLEGVFILIVDDDDGNRTALQALCSRYGGQVATASNAEDALTELGQHLRTPDIMLTDLKLGEGEDGLSLVSLLRSHTEETTPCILLTAETTPSVAVRARQLGVGLVYKPASADRVISLIVEELKRGSSSDSSYAIERPSTPQAPA